MQNRLFSTVSYLQFAGENIYQSMLTVAVSTTTIIREKARNKNI